jgi:hypothetical protein
VPLLMHIYQKLTVLAELSEWLINAFNGEWLRIANPKPLIDLDKRRKVKRQLSI